MKPQLQLSQSLFAAILAIFLFTGLAAQTIPQNHSTNRSCISREQEEHLKQEREKNIAQFRKSGIYREPNLSIDAVNFRWPLRPTASFDDF
ncbi:MAG: hypothetical protein H7246_11545, partial [Phycisphaerae bacterium]|nr:hypothetical protein [Saprospiraceae bacterium]